MKKLKKFANKKIVFIIISLVIAIFGLLTIGLGIYAQKYDEYSFYTDEQNGKIFINEIKIGDSIVELGRYQYKNSKYDDKLKKIVFSNADNYIIKKSKIDNLKLSFQNKSNFNKQIIVRKNNKIIKTINLRYNSSYVYMDNTSTFSIIKSLIESLSFIKIVIAIIILLIFSLAVYLSLLYISNFIEDTIKDKFSIIEYIISILLLLFINILYIFPMMQFNKYIAILPMIVSLIIIVYCTKKNINIKLHNYYILISMFIGVIFLLIFPPLHVPDEFTHLIKSYQSSYLFQDNHEITKSQTYAYLPKKMNEFAIKYGDETLNSYFRMQPRTYTYDLFKTINYNALSDSYSWYGLKYTPSLPYLPGTIVSIIARLINMPLLIFYYLSRIFTYIISTLMCYYAIKIAPKFKKIFFVVPLLPIYIQQSYGFNIDWLTNSTFILLLAYILKGIYENNKITRNDSIKIILLSVLLGFCKFGYFPIALLFLLIPTGKKISKKFKRIVVIFTILIPILVTILFSVYRNSIYLKFGGVVSTSSKLIPISMLWNNSKMIASMVFQTFKIRLELDFFRGFVSGFGWSTIWTNSFLLFICLGIFLLVLLCDDEYNIKLKTKEKILFVVSFIAMCGFIYGAMLFGWTKIGSVSIDGLQPRYFIPPIMLLYILLQNKYVIINVANKKLFYAISIIIINFIGIVTILENIYI